MVHILLLLGLGLIAIAAKSMYPYYLAKGWRKTSAKIVAMSEMQADVPMRYGSLRHFFPEVEYEYEINGCGFHSNRVSFEKENIWQPEVNVCGDPNNQGEFLWAKWESGTVIDIYFKPDNPAVSVIVRDLDKKRRSHHLAIMFGGAIITLLWALLHAQ